MNADKVETSLYIIQELPSNGSDNSAHIEYLEIQEDDCSERSNESEVLGVMKRVPMIVHQEHTPHWMVHNKYILYGYRVHFHSKRDLLKSLFMKHNELLNIWTHLIGGIIFVVFVFYIIFSFDLLSTVYQKVNDFINPQNMDMMKQEVPSLLERIE